MALEKELATYKAKLPDLKEHQGKFVLIHGDEVVDFFVAYEDAIKAGYGKFRLEPFLVKQVSVSETVHYFTRHIIPFIDPALNECIKISHSFRKNAE
jgi:tRNA(Ile)-lysidine synthase TilS/MesJ